MLFNINGEVRVKLTEFGFKVHRQNHYDLFRHLAKLPPYTRPDVDKDGWSRFQMWTLMQEFGSSVRMGGDQPFELEIDIPEKADV